MAPAAKIRSGVLVDYTVVVVGGGPAGTLAALKLIRAGLRVLIVDRDRPRRAEVAEILAPEGKAILEREGVWDSIPDGLTRPCPSIEVAWEAPDPIHSAFGGQAAGPAWHLDRIRFDEWMLRHVEAAGVRVATGTVEAARRRGDGWEIECRTSHTSRSTS